MGSGPGTAGRRGGGGGGGGGGGVDLNLAGENWIENLVEANLGTATEAREALPEPGSLESGVKLAQEFGIDVQSMSRDALVAKYGKDFNNALAVFDPKDGKIYVNTTLMKNPKQIAAQQSKFARVGWHSSGHPDAVYHHEIGHQRHYQNIKKGVVGKRTWNELSDRKVSKRLAKIINKQVSKYAASDRLEIVAEMYSGMRGGKKYSPALMKYYRKLGGPSVS